MRPNRVRLIVFATVTLIAGAVLAADWPAWGGPNGNFTTESTGLASSWRFGGPPEIWRRPLGEGYSAIVVVGEDLYTMYRKGETEWVVALDAATGETRWEFAYDSPTRSKDWSFDRGPGPHATPAVAGNRIFVIGSTTKFHALDRNTGNELWSHDFLGDFDGSFRHRGYSSSPLVYGETVLASVGGAGRSLVAFRQSDGSVVWRAGDDDASYSSPILIELGGKPQVAAFGANEIVGFEPETGALLWSHPHPTRNAFNISTPIWSDDGLLFLSSAYDGGGRVVRLTGSGNATRVEELWFSNQVRIHFGTGIRVGDTVYASSGDFGPAPMKAVDIESGDVLWQDRSFAKHSLVYGDGKLVVLAEDGTLGLVRANRDGMEKLAESRLFDSLAWTVPTLVGTRLYARSRQEIVAVELGEQ